MPTRYRVDLFTLRAFEFNDFIIRQRKVLNFVITHLREALDADRQHTYWSVSDWFKWTSQSVNDDNYALLIKRMDGGVTPKPTGEEWLYGIIFPRRKGESYRNILTKIAGNATNFNKFFFYGWDQSFNTSVDADGGQILRFSDSLFQDVELTGTTWTTTPFSIGDHVADVATGEKVGKVIWIDGLNDKHMIIRMMTGDFFVSGDVLENGTDQLSGVLVNLTMVWDTEITGNSWVFGGPFVPGDLVSSSGGGNQAEIVWVDPDDDRHIRVHTLSGVRFQDGDNVEKDVGNILGLTTVNDSNMHDIGFTDNVYGIEPSSYTVMVTNINNNGGADFTPGEDIITTGGGKATYEGISGTFRNRFELTYAYGDFRPGMILSTDRGGPTDATAVIMPTNLVHVSGGSGSFTFGEEIYTASGKGFFVQESSTSPVNTVHFLSGRQDLISTDFGLAPSPGDSIQNSTGTTHGIVVSVFTGIPGQVTWTILYDSSPFVVTEDVYKVGDPATYANNIVVQNTMQRSGEFWGNETLYGVDSGATRNLEGEDFNYFVDPFTSAKNPYGEIHDFFPMNRDGQRGNATRGVYDVAFQFPTHMYLNRGMCLVLEWDRPFLVMYQSWSEQPCGSVVFLQGEIYTPLEGKRLDPYVNGNLSMTVYTSSDLTGWPYTLRIEGYFGFKNGGGGLTTFSRYANQFYTWSHLRGTFPTETWDWERITISNDDEFKGYLRKDMCRNIGYHGYDSSLPDPNKPHAYDNLKVFHEFTDDTKVFFKYCTQFTLPWVKDEPVFPPFDWNKYDTGILYRERY